MRPRETIARLPRIDLGDDAGVLHERPASSAWPSWTGRDAASIVLRCPRGHEFVVRIAGHEARRISPEGLVADAIACLAQGCGWRARVRLLGWTVPRGTAASNKARPGA